jgi:hypothetical protein
MKASEERSEEKSYGPVRQLRHGWFFVFVEGSGDPVQIICEHDESKIYNINDVVVVMAKNANAPQGRRGRIMRFDFPREHSSEDFVAVLFLETSSTTRMKPSDLELSKF